MKTELIDVSPTRKEIKIEIEPQTVREAYDRISAQYAKKVSVPGFRPGHAPRSVVRTRFKAEIHTDLLREIVPDAINSAINELELQPLGEPDIHLDNTDALNRPGEEPLSVHVHVEVLPTVELNEYKGVEAVRRVRPVSDSDVDELIDHLREASASLQPVEDRGAELGDTVTVDFRGKFIEPEGDEDINVEDVDVVLGGEGVQAEFTENLTGTQSDDEKTFLVSYPEDFSAKGLAGKKVEYTATVKAVRIKELPELDDEWARSVSDETETFETLREKLRKDLENRSRDEADERLRNEVMRKILEQHEFEVPETLVDHQTNDRLESIVRDMIGRGIDPRSQKLDWEGARAELKVQAADTVRITLLLDKIAEQENLSVSDEEIQNEIDSIVEFSRQPREKVVAALTKEGGERSIANRLRNRKALDLLIENARVTEEEWRDETPPAAGSITNPKVEGAEAQSNQTDEEERKSDASSSL